MEGFEKWLAEGNTSDELDVEGNGLLHHCAALENLDMMAKILPFVDIDQKTRDDRETALMIACGRKNAKMVQFLLENGANIDLENGENKNVLQICIDLETENLLSLLLSFNPNSRAKGKAVITAVCNHSLSAIELLHESGANLELKINTEYRLNALMTAAQIGPYEMVALLIEKKVSLLKTDDKGLDALMHAIVGRNLKIVKLIVETAEKMPVGTSFFAGLCSFSGKQSHKNLLDIILNRTDKFGESPLTLASWIGDLEVFTYLVAKGADVHHRNANGISPFWTACKFGHLDLVRFLLEQIGVDVDESDEDGITALTLAAYFGNPQIVSYLLDKGAEIDRVTLKKMSALMFAAQQGKQTALETLISRGANVNLATERGETALALACINESHECVSILIRSGADVNVKDNFNWYPIQIAVSNKDLLSVKHLVEGGADLNVFSDSPEQCHLCPLSLAILSESIEIAGLLLQNGAQVSIRNGEGRTILHVACTKDYSWMTLALIRHGIDVNGGDINGMTPLMTCADRENLEIAKILLEHGADPNMIDANGSTALLRGIKAYICAEDDQKYGYLELIRALFAEYGADADIPDKNGATARKLMSGLNDSALF